MLARQAAAAVGVGTCWPWETAATLPSARRREVLRRPRGRRGRGHITTASPVASCQQPYYQRTLLWSKLRRPARFCGATERVPSFPIPPRKEESLFSGNQRQLGTVGGTVVDAFIIDRRRQTDRDSWTICCLLIRPLWSYTVNCQSIIKRCFCLTSVCLSRTSGLTREQRGLGNWHRGSPRNTWLRHHFQDPKVKGQLVADVLNSQHAGTGATWRINMKILSTCRGRRHIVSPSAQLVSNAETYYITRALHMSRRLYVSCTSIPYAIVKAPLS